MAASGFPSENLGQQSLFPLRDLASRLGIGRLSRSLKRQWLLAMESEGSAPEAEPLRDLGLPSAAAASGQAPEGEVPSSAAGEAQPLPGSPLAAQLPPRPASQGETRVVFLPRDPQWAYVFWEICQADRESALAAGAGPLVLRLEDVTGRQDGHAHPHTLQEVVVDAGAHEWYLPVPMSDRDYRVELGFRRTGGGLISLAVSGVARMPAQGPTGIVADRFIPFSLDGVTSTPVEGPPNPSLGLHERLYQQASGAHRRLGHGSEAFQEQGQQEGAAAAGQRSGVGLWASGRNDSGAGLATRQRSFWLVADAELVVYGATEPSALLRIGEEVVPLSSDGTFKVQVPFRDGEQIYPISAVAADGVQKRSITLAFSRTTPEANVNSSEDSVAEWF
ncbi:MAG: DUF4912 domain-containing protein [Cyanobacteria bacterium]|nr:DUF4912 domain-containing protein [Cyanobacteriota bacterium]